MTGKYRRLRLQQVLTGLDEDRIHPPSSMPMTCSVYASRKSAKGAAQRGKFGAGTDGTEDISRVVSGAVVPGGVSGDLGPACASSRIRLLNAVLSQVGEIRPNVFVSTASTPTSKKASCSDRTTSGRVTLSTSLQPLMSFEVVEAQIVGLQHGPRCTIGNDDTAG